MEMKFISVHRHEVFLATSKKLASNCYSVNGYKEVKIYEEMKLSTSDTYFSLFCDKCKQFLLKNDYVKEFIIPEKNKEGLINCINEKGKIENVYFGDKPLSNSANKKNNNLIKFYQLNNGPEYDNNTIYVGTLEEQKEYFHKKYIELKQKLISQEEENKDNKIKLEKGEKELAQFRSGVSFRGDMGEIQDAYDIIIGINSILSLNKEGWNIKYPKGKDDYEKKCNKKSIIIGVLGNRNKGKSFILGKLSGYDVPQGFAIKTEGISIRFGEKEDHCIAILDSAGQEVPLLNIDENKNKDENNEEKQDLNNINDNLNKIEIKEKEGIDEINILEERLRDKLITEKFIEKFIMNTAHILVLVVGDITLNEQKLLERVKNSIKKDKYLFVLHNLQNFQNKWQVNDYIENTLKKLFGIKIEENNYQNLKENRHNKYYVEENNRKITHLILVNDYSNIAEYYNQPAVEFLKQKLAVEQNRTVFSVIEKCKEFFLKIQSDFLEKSINIKDFEQNENKILLNNKNISLKRVYIDEIGKTITNDSDTPNYYYYTEKNELIINIELPGPNPEIGSKIDQEGEFYKINFKGKKPSDTSNSEEVHTISKNLKKQIPFEFSILISKKDITILPNDKGKIQWYSRTEKNENGIFTFKYRILGDFSNDDYE